MNQESQKLILHLAKIQAGVELEEIDKKIEDLIKQKRFLRQLFPGLHRTKQGTGTRVKQPVSKIPVEKISSYFRKSQASAKPKKNKISSAGRARQIAAAKKYWRKWRKEHKRA